MKFRVRAQNKYTFIIGSFLLGLAFAAMGIYTAASSIQNITFDYIGILHLHAYFPFLWVTDALIIVFPLMSFYGFRYIEESNIKLEEQFTQENRRSEIFYSFIENLRKGNVDAEIGDIETKDRLAESLVKLRDELKVAKEEEIKRNKEDEERRWITEGLAVFGEYLRSTNELSALSYLLISKLVEYIEVEQGGFFVYRAEKEEKYFEQTGAFAYDRKKYCDQKIPWGEGLIGACGIEKKATYLPEVTEGYVNITSGLGKANPKVVFIVPLMRDFEIQGIMEFASLTEIPKYRRDFLEKLGESIAITLQNISTERITSKLLDDTQKKTEALAKQEETLKQNMEKLKKVQAEKAKQAEEFISFTNSVNHTLIRGEYKPDGTLIYANNNFIFKLEYFSNSEVEGRSIMQFINPKDRNWFSEMWEKLSKGGNHFEGEMKHMTKTGKDLWTMSTYTCVRLPDGTIEKILFLAIDITKQKTVSLYHNALSNAINQNSIQAELDLEGHFITANKKFLLMLDIPDKKLTKTLLTNLIIGNEAQFFSKKWEQLEKGRTYDAIFEFKTLTDNKKWLRGTFSPVFNIYKEVERIVFIAHDITQQIESEEKLKNQTTILEEQEQELKMAKEKLSHSLREAKVELKQQYEAVENIKVLNERTLEGLLDAVITIDNNNIVTFFNKAAENIWKITADKIIGNSLKLIIPEEVNVDEYIGKYFFSGSTFIGIRKEVFIVDKEGNKFSVLLTLSEGKYKRKYSLTAFIQTIEVELF